MQAQTRSPSVGTPVPTLFRPTSVLASRVTPQGPDFLVGLDDLTIPTSQTRMRQGCNAAGFPARPTRAPGIEYTLPDGSSVRTPDPSGQAPRRASFAHAHGPPIAPWTGKPPPPPSGLARGARRQFGRDRTHMEQTLCFNLSSIACVNYFLSQSRS